jgi:hypothetical protein
MEDIYSCVNCAFSFVWTLTRFGLMTFIRRGLQGWELIFCWLLTREMVMRVVLFKMIWDMA